ncbi:MAG TPA: hypothetical protein VK358_09470, partial [Longimicrobium sp.]|nr:hypothetical protein [Longimicrobium sp.]
KGDMIMGKQAQSVRRAKHRVKARGLLNRLRYDIPAPSLEVARARILSKPGLFASLSKEAIEILRNWDGPEVLGPPRKEERE